MHYIVNLIIDDTVVATNESHHNAHKTLLLAWELLGGIPSAEVCVRREGALVAYLKTDWKGRLEEAVVCTAKGHNIHLNPDWTAFREVFAS